MRRSGNVVVVIFGVIALISGLGSAAPTYSQWSDEDSVMGSIEFAEVSPGDGPESGVADESGGGGTDVPEDEPEVTPDASTASPDGDQEPGDPDAAGRGTPAGGSEGSPSEQPEELPQGPSGPTEDGPAATETPQPSEFPEEE